MKFTFKRTWLSRLRKAHRYSQQSLAVDLGVSPRTVKNWENSGTFPDHANKMSLARILGQEVLDKFHEEECELLNASA